MKNVKHLVMALLVIVAGITSCKKETTPPAQAGTNEITETQTNVLLPATKFRLTKQGNTYLHYQNDGKLWRVIFSPTNYIEYSWVFNGVIATNYIDNKKYSTNYTMINGSGKCYHSTFKKYKGDLVDFQWSWKYEYFNNQLIKQVNPDDADERYEFTYNVDGNLEKINYYSKQGVLTNTTAIKYNLVIIGPKVDKSPINPETAEIERYLQLYGKFSDYLPMSIKQTFIPNNTITKSTSYIYSLNENGYVKTRKWQEWGILKETAEYQYQQIR
ncbi:hypothetical protein HB364_19100 [Pseudoflavitalea sp. X16]|uniref:hypothetical protein n=1 Tax=Paraflavitalea devenefica TaxID=2716334 RepID=UPI00141FE86A|nr:hypothetical protein [Paraflavitalea devenefica]NII27204.1 hypothetical protein [Paraflavitalea devenefica]